MVVFVVLALVVTACSGGQTGTEVDVGAGEGGPTPTDQSLEARAATLQRTDAPPFDAAVTPVAAGDSSLVYVSHVPGPPVFDETLNLADRVAISFADGSWAELPKPPPIGAARAVMVDGSVALVGVECVGDGECLQFSLVGALLSEDMTTWEPIEFPELTTQDFEAVTPTAIAPGVFSGLGRFFEVHPDRTVTSLPYPPLTEQVPEGFTGAAAVNCVVDRQLVVTSLTAPSPSGLTGDESRYVTSPSSSYVFVSDLDDPGQRWTQRSGPPVELVNPTAWCGQEGPMLLDAGSELSYAVASDTWSSRAVDLPPGLRSGFTNTASVLATGLGEGRAVLEVPREFDPSDVVPSEDLEALAEQYEEPGWDVYVRGEDGTYVFTGEVVHSSFVAGGRFYTGLGSIDQVREVPL